MPDEQLAELLLEHRAIEFSARGVKGDIHTKYPNAPLVPYQVRVTGNSAGPLPEDALDKIGRLLAYSVMHRLRDQEQYVAPYTPASRVLIKPFMDQLSYFPLEELQADDQNVDTAKPVILIAGVITRVDAVEAEVRRLQNRGLQASRCCVVINRTGISRYTLQDQAFPIEAAIDLPMLFLLGYRMGKIDPETYGRIRRYPTELEEYLATQTE